MEKPIESSSPTIQNQPITPALPKDSKFYQVIIPLLSLVLVVLLGSTVFLYLKLQNLSSKNLKDTEDTTVVNTSPITQVDKNKNELINDSELTGWIYLGPHPYQLVYRIDTKKELGKYVLKSAVENVSDVELTKEDDIDQGGVTGVAISPDNTKFIITSVLGDGAKRILIGVNKLKDDTLSQPIELREISLQDRYLFTYHNVLSWVDNDRILIKKTDYDDKTGQIVRETYWVAPISNVATMKEVQL